MIGSYRNVGNTPHSLVSLVSTYLCKFGISTMVFIKLYIEIALNRRMNVRYVQTVSNFLLNLIK